MAAASEIVLATLNARYIHASFGLRYLRANLGPLRERSTILEFEINRRPLEIAEAILSHQPTIVGLGVYIWNATASTELVSLLKRIRPDLIIILGGPEVSYEAEQQEVVRLADYLITGEADLAFAKLCQEILDGNRPSNKIIAAPLPQFSNLALPYDEYLDEDIAHRVIYVEASRGCPFSCEFCLSSLDIPVRAAPTEPFLAALDRLLQRGATHLKFVDRTFNLNFGTSKAILEFCLARWQPGRFFHFEMIPDRLPEGLREIIAQFPPGALQFEVGIQTFNPEVAKNISRRNHYGKLAENLTWLRQHSHVHIHADLIAGLPGETLDSFAKGFDTLFALGPQEIQVGILKRLRGTPITRHDAEFAMVYAEHPPYEVLSTRHMSFDDLQRMRRFAKWHDQLVNSGNFPDTAALLAGSEDSPFAAFMALSDWLHRRTGRADGVALLRFAELLFEFLVDAKRVAPEVAAETIWRDYTRPGRRERPPARMENFLSAESRKLPPVPTQKPTTLARQKRHLATME